MSPYGLKLSDVLQIGNGFKMGSETMPKPYM
jgi:hypothetical protein